MKILYFPLKKKWYEMIESGIKKEEYRSNNPYWRKRILDCYDANTDCKIYIQEGCNYCKKPQIKKFDAVRFSYGYTKRTMAFECKGIEIGKGHPEWGAPEKEDVFIIKLGGKNMKEFDLKKAKEGKTVRTRDGRIAKIIIFDLNGKSGKNIAAVVKEKDGKTLSLHTLKMALYSEIEKYNMT